MGQQPPPKAPKENKVLSYFLERPHLNVYELIVTSDPLLIIRRYQFKSGNTVNDHEEEEFMSFCVAYKKWAKENPKAVKKMGPPPSRKTFSFKPKDKQRESLKPPTAQEENK